MRSRVNDKEFRLTEMRTDSGVRIRAEIRVITRFAQRGGPFNQISDMARNRLKFAWANPQSPCTHIDWKKSNCQVGLYHFFKTKSFKIINNKVIPNPIHIITVLAALLA